MSLDWTDKATAQLIRYAVAADRFFPGSGKKLSDKADKVANLALTQRGMGKNVSGTRGSQLLRINKHYSLAYGIMSNGDLRITRVVKSRRNTKGR